MYIARFSYDVQPVNRQSAIEFIHREVEAARRNQLRARLLVPLTRGQGGAALQFEVELTSLDQFDRFREHGIGNDEETGRWMHAFSEILTSPPTVELLRVENSR
ncbi:hypothetical protein KXS07_03770 [Inquilinus limosus]|uniref:hypothetical protein n=1 Tax=Inquilinus limosus TaxID=171674 RepID=UPI0004033062|nr:hypothetical protein [Inquilinus limosus]